MGLLDAGTVAAAAAAVALGQEVGDEMREGILRAIAEGGRTWTVQRPAGGLTSARTLTALPDPVTLDVVKTRKLGLGTTLAGALGPGANFVAFGDAGQDLAEQDVITCVETATLVFRVMSLEERNGRVEAILATVKAP